MSSSASASAVWPGLLERVMSLGEITADAKRGELNSGRTRELLCEKTVVDMHKPIVCSTLRKLNYKFMAAEAWWILSGRSDLASISVYNKVMAKFSDDGQTLFGAYGPPIKLQLEGVVNELARDPGSRRAVLTIWRQNPPASRDIPCTVAIQFLIRNNHIYCIDNMRSSDAWLGWPYDVFNFSMLSLAVLIELRRQGIEVNLGDLILVAGSQHLYERDWNGALDCVAADVGRTPFIKPSCWPTYHALLDYLKAVADGRASFV